MGINWKRPGWTWAKNTAEVAGVAFAADLGAAWLEAPTPDLAAIDWLHALSHGGYDALGIVLYGVLALRVPNGTWSRIRAVVARDKITIGRGENGT